MNFEEIRNALPATSLMQVEGLPFQKIASGKVRDIFDLGEYLLIVASDRISAFDVVLPDGVAGKGIMLTQLSLHWFDHTKDIIANHLAPDHQEVAKEYLADFPDLIPRSMVVRKLKPLPIEAVVRGYLSGSGWKSYREDGALFGQELPKGLLESDRLNSPKFTPTTKSHSGHDMPISLNVCKQLIGEETYQKVFEKSLALYDFGVRKAEKVNLILADTKFEFGLNGGNGLFLIDEILTADSSRYWPQGEYEPGRGQYAFDKQFVRDYLNRLDWDKKSPGPPLPQDVIESTQQRYLSVLEKLIGVPVPSS